MRAPPFALSLTLVSLALLGCPDPGKDKVKAQVSPAPAPSPSAAAPAALANATAYPFTNEGSAITFVGAKVTGKHDGGFKVFGGIVEVVEGELTKSRVRAEIDMGSVWSDNEKLTGHLKSPDFFDVEKHPKAAFTSQSFKKLEGDRFEVTGDLSLHGVTKRITFPATITVTPQEVTVVADFAINRKDFEIVYAGKADDLIADNVALKLDLHAKTRGG